MRVLWFSNTPANADEFLGKELRGSGGWLKSLNQIVQEKVELHIVFLCGEVHDSFKYENTIYHPIKRVKKNKVLMNIDIKQSFYINEYLRIINKVNPDIIHIHGTEQDFGDILTKIDIPVVLSIQGVINVIAYKFWGNLNPKMLVFQNSLNSIKKLFFLKLAHKRISKQANRESEYLKNSSNIIGRTDFDRRVVKLINSNAKYFKLNEILRNGFYENYKKSYEIEKVIKILTICNSAPYKGLETIVMASNFLNKNGHVNFEWNIAGIVEKDLIIDLVKLLCQQEIPTELKFLGNLTDCELIEQMKKSDIYVNASHIENSSNSIGEAMLIGLPCIVTFAGGTSSLIKDGDTGILIQDGDPWVMAGTILELANSEENREKLGSRARAEALRRHDSKVIVSELIKIYSDTVKNNDK